MINFYFKFKGKKIGHKLAPDLYSARMIRTRFNQAGNLEVVLTNIKPVKHVNKLTSYDNKGNVLRVVDLDKHPELDPMRTVRKYVAGRAEGK